jgi:choline dehydrogenase-like flavoprotein
MIINWADFKAGSRDIDVCIVGGGAAGLTLADALTGSGLSVLVLEAGGLKQTPAAQDPYRGEVVDPASHPWLEHFRVRAIGGASRAWGGRCLPFDPIDFEQRDWVPGPGWPIGLQSLEEDYRLAQIAAEAGPFDYDPASALPGAQAELAPGLDGPRIVTRLERFSRPTNFWTRFREALAGDPRVHVLMDAPVLAVRLTPDGGTVDHLDVRSSDGATVEIRARHYVLAGGGLETVRLMLASDDVKPGGVGGDSGHLGRHYMSHIAATAGQVVFADPAHVAFDYAIDAAGVYVRRRLTLTAQAQRELKCLNVAFRTHLPDPSDPSHGDAILSAMYLVKDLVLYEYSRKLRERRPTAGLIARHIGNVARDPQALARFSRRWIEKRILADRKLPSVVLGSANGTYALEFHAEQTPNPDSRLTLSDARDQLGQRRLRVDWRMSETDVLSLQKAYGVLAEELVRTGTGVLDYDPATVADRARAEGAYGGHHIGAARMSASPEDGVVDSQCRVHGVGNLHIASAAVFPTSGQANPTLTILALTLRLAARLRHELTRP